MFNKFFSSKKASQTNHVNVIVSKIANQAKVNAVNFISNLDIVPAKQANLIQFCVA